MVTKGMEVILEVKMVTPGAISDFFVDSFFFKYGSRMIWDGLDSEKKHSHLWPQICRLIVFEP